MNKRWVGWVTCLILVPVLAGCGDYERGKQAIAILDKLLNESGTTAILWDEEVTLHDGSVIVIKRREVKGSGGFPINTMNRRGITQSYEFCYPAMGLYWKSKGEYHPEILGILNSKAYVKVPINGEVLCMLHEYPGTNALYYVWETNAWRKIPYEAFPKEIRRINLLQDPWGIKPEDDVRGTVTVTQKENRDQIYWFMKRTGKQSITEMFSYPGDCERAKDINVFTNTTPEVFLPPTPDFCQSPK